MRTGQAVKSLIGASVGAALLLAATVTPSHATAVTLTGTGSNGRSASATFDNFSFMGNNYLQVTLTNTATHDPSAPSQILTAIFFSLSGDPTLAKSGAFLASGSNVKNVNPDPTNLGTEWAYKSGLSVSGFNQGISSTGLGLFGGGDRFITCSSCDLQGPDSPDGVQYGISTLNDTTGNDNGGLDDQQLVRNSVVFYLGGISSSFDPSLSITSVRFQYGTSLSEPHFVTGGNGHTKVPYPSSLALLGFGVIGAVLVVRRRAVLGLVRA
jgi:hypothetical protein